MASSPVRHFLTCFSRDNERFTRKTQKHTKRMWHYWHSLFLHRRHRASSGKTVFVNQGNGIILSWRFPNLFLWRLALTVRSLSLCLSFFCLPLSCLCICLLVLPTLEIIKASEDAKGKNSTAKLLKFCLIEGLGKMQENIFKFNGFNGFEIQTLPVLGSASAK